MNLLKAKISGIARGVIVFIALVLQVATMFIISSALQQYATVAYPFIEMLSVILAFRLANDYKEYKEFWLVIVIVLPVFGYFMYFMWGRTSVNRGINRRLRKAEEDAAKMMKQDHDAMNELKRLHPNKVQISRYLAGQGYPIYRNTYVKYFPIGDELLRSLIEDLRKAEKFILLEYFIISAGEIWNEVEKILFDKAANGVEVRLIMDDFGCLLLNDNDFKQNLKEHNIKFKTFGPIHQEVTRFSFNFRDHRKIAVIDGNVGYTGGVNLADEYANIIDRFGHWKDSGVRLEGEGVWSFTCFFMEMWEAISKKTEDYSPYKPTVTVKALGFVQPYSGGTHKINSNTSASAYTHIINKAREYLYITTPYLVLDNLMREDIISAANSGVDVRIITPKRYDKWYVHMVTIFNYGYLLKNGVKIYEYSKGFIHAKNVITDDECGICGTINMDYRSLYLHYECGVVITDNPSVLDMKKDFLSTLKVSEKITYERWLHRPLRHKLMQFILKILSPML